MCAQKQTIIVIKYIITKVYLVLMVVYIDFHFKSTLMLLHCILLSFKSAISFHMKETAL